VTGPEAGRSLGSALWTLLRFALAAYAVWLVGACFLQRRVLFPTYAVRTPSAGPPALDGFERGELATDDGPVEWWFFAAPGASAVEPAPLVLACHGNGELIDFQLDVVRGYRELGFHVLLCEYRGYGRSAGSPTQAALVADQRAALELALARPEVDAERLLYHGRSLGTGVACALARERAPRALVLVAPFTSVKRILLGYAVPPFLALDPFDNAAVLRELRPPTLIFHGARDRSIPVEHARDLARVHPEAELVVFEGAGHNDLPVDGREAWGRVGEFLQAEGLGPR